MYPLILRLTFSLIYFLSRSCGAPAGGESNVMSRPYLLIYDYCLSILLTPNYRCLFTFQIYDLSDSRLALILIVVTGVKQRQ